MQRSLKIKFFFSPAFITLGSILLTTILFLVGLPLLDLIELKTYDLRFLSRDHRVPSQNVVLAVIDEKSLDTEGRWPWPRSKIADLVNILSQDGAKVIGFDIGFLEPDENAQLKFINQLDRRLDALDIADKELIEYVNESKTNADNDLALAKAFKNSASSVVLGYFFHMKDDDLYQRIEKRELNRLLEQISPSKYPFILYEDQDMAMSPFITAGAPETNLGILAETADLSGYFNLITDQDGAVRRMPLIIKFGKDLFPPLPVLCAWQYLDRPQLMVKVALYGVEGIQMGKDLIPTDENGLMLVNYLGPPGAFSHFSISDILHGKASPGTFKDKIVLVGSTATGIFDSWNTPFGPVFPGVELHATVIDNIINKNFLKKPKWARIYDLIAIIVLGTLTGIVLPRLNALMGLIFATVLFVLYIVIAHLLFVRTGAWLHMVYPLLVVAITYTALTAHHYFTEERERKKIRGAFKHYVSDTVIKEMLNNPDQLALGGAEKELTVLFSDLADFTTYSERLAPNEMVNILSEYFAEMTEIVFACSGTLKEYVADELMAIFGAPLEQSDHAQQACFAALAMQDRLRVLRRTWAETGRPALKARIGINSGPMLVGNLGSRYRFSYGALGDQVNLGSRLEGLNREYGTEILVGENTARLVQGSFRLRELDMVRVKGRKQPVRIYELLDRAGVSLPENEEQALSLYAAGLDAYRRQRWQEALDLFRQARTLRPEDGPSHVMSRRCRIYRTTPPEKGWDGVFQQVTK
jgi:adenylate cyclase